MSLTLAEQYLTEAFPQSWLARVEVSELPVYSQESDTEEDQEPEEDFHGPIYVIVGNRGIQL